MEIETPAEDLSKEDENALYKLKWKKAVKSWKRMKDEGDKKRPPWKSVSVSTLPKADKNALLRAKLLDASRRLRLSKLSIAIQVDLPIYKPSNTIGIPIQNDLILKHDVSILTDGSITLKKEGPGEFILTHSASQMTEAIVGIDSSTQTLLPRSTTRFWEAYLSNDPQCKDSSFTPIEQNLQTQIREIRKINKQISQRSKSYEEMSDDSITGNGDKTSLIKHFKKISKSTGSLLKPTLSSWHFEYPVEEETHWKPYTTKAIPWSSFSNTEIEDRLSNMKLQPILADKQKAPNTDIQECALNADLYDAVQELVVESNSLVETFSRLSSVLIKEDLKVKPPIESFKINSLSDYWVPIVEKHEANVKKLTSELKHPKIRKAKPIVMADLDRILHPKTAV
ncbi:uncharacterized protein LOC129913822 isoform X2 [Episyrphus balteatus]|uniref:uncharacterized protein LOC129913822 isoform X2 n=1 Tax=Episyrphus balteatus TaxID=286459 RepID=UPI002485613F|nr:uncharacterized protein LOC129913822 isoform X2 [Episyrphus balteatus]